MKLTFVAPILLAGCVTAFAPSASRSTSTSLHGVAGDEIRDARSSYAKAINYQRAGGEIGNDGSAVSPDAIVVAPYGEVGDSVSGHDVRGARSSYAKPTNYHFTSGEIGNDGSAVSPDGFFVAPYGEVGETVNGHDVRGARSSYAKPQNYHFTSGEIGSDGSAVTLEGVVVAPYGEVGETVNGHDVRGARSSYASGANYHFETREIGYDGTPRRQVNASSGPYVQQKVSPEFLPHSSTGAGDHSPAPPAATATEVAEALSTPPAPSSSGPTKKSYGIGSWKK